MKVLQVNKFHYFRGGAETYYLKISQKLQEEGHKVAYFSMHHPKNLTTFWSKYFVSELNFTNPKIKDKLKALTKIFYNQEAKRNFSKLLEDFKPNIIHCHNIYYHLSPSILTEAKKRNIPVVMHLHDYNLICPNYKLYTNNHVCYKCKGGKYYNCLLNKCFSESWGKTVLATLEKYLHNSYWKIYKKNIDLYISPSKFLKNIFLSFGYKEKNIKVLRNFTFKSNTYDFKKEKDYFLYFGRLSQEKGIEVILKALKKSNKELKVKIVGTGPQEKFLKTKAKKLGLNNQVEFLGWKDPKELENIILEAKGIIMPSLWLENMPFSLLESLEKSKILIASNIGGFKEMIKDKENGFLFNPGKEEELKDILENLDNYNLEEIKQKAQETALKLNLEKHYKELLHTYKKALK